ncbi:MAG: phosphoribosylformylglycinamidine synthase subunit PurS [Nanoarchaeota archaeon]
MSYLIEILVKPKDGILNPEARVIGEAAKSLGYDLKNLNKGKYFSYASEKSTKEEAEKEAKELSEKLLSNPIIEKYEIVSIK